MNDSKILHHSTKGEGFIHRTEELTRKVRICNRVGIRMRRQSAPAGPGTFSRAS
jgi:hypothetical protein